MITHLKKLVHRFNILQGTLIYKIIGNDEFVISCLQNICEKKYSIPSKTLVFYGVGIDKGRAVYSDLRFPGLRTHYFLTLREVIGYVGISESINRCLSD